MSLLALSWVLVTPNLTPGRNPKARRCERHVFQINLWANESLVSRCHLPIWAPKEKNLLSAGAMAVVKFDPPAVQVNWNEIQVASAAELKFKVFNIRSWLKAAVNSNNGTGRRVCVCRPYNNV